MAEGDEDKTTFFIGKGVFYYQKMPFGLKNARATYQRLVDKVFNDQIGRNLEAYIDDLMIKGVSEEEMLADIKETFENFLINQQELNQRNVPSVGVEEGRILRTPSLPRRVIRANPLRSLPFFKVLKSCTDKKNIQWTQEAEAALKEIKKFGDELNYPGMEKLILEVVHAARRLRRRSMDIGVSKKGLIANETMRKRIYLCPTLRIRNDKQRSIIRSTIGQVANITRDGNYKLSNLCRLIIVCQSNKRNQNKKANALSKLAAMTFKHLTKEVLVEVLLKRLIEEKEILQNHEARVLLVVNAAKILQDYEKCKKQSAIRKVSESSAITAESGWPFSHWGVNILGPLPIAPRGFKFLAIAAEHSTKWILSATNNQLKGREAFPKRTLPRNSQKETLFSLTYGFEAIIPISETNVTKDDRGRIKEVDKRRGSKEIASIEEAYYQSKLRRHHSERSSHSIYNVRDFVLLSQNNTGSAQVW
ncbi:hypothetical protein Tco_1045027 [Tanacetum coccineum]|uniref:Reverse transcriptase domain-containing protein n=1 Tax=Tanacetum coccineum TaxID=301880 RepID=A0ABQ5GRK9_9ASTR